MIEYPSIPDYNPELHGEMKLITQLKRDGVNFRMQYKAGYGFVKFGSRRVLIDPQEPGHYFLLIEHAEEPYSWLGRRVRYPVDWGFDRYIVFTEAWHWGSNFGVVSKTLDYFQILDVYDLERKEFIDPRKHSTKEQRIALYNANLKLHDNGADSHIEFIQDCQQAQAVWDPDFLNQFQKAMRLHQLEGFVGRCPKTYRPVCKYKSDWWLEEAKKHYRQLYPTQDQFPNQI